MQSSGGNFVQGVGENVGVIIAIRKRVNVIKQSASELKDSTETPRFSRKGESSWKTVVCFVYLLN